MLEKLNPGTEVVGIDEGQFFDFFDNELVKLQKDLAKRGVKGNIVNLDQDYTDT